jgi:superfamily II DNA or RNA helicase
VFQLRPYQQEAYDSIAAAHQQQNSVLLELATGCGKTVVFCRYASSWEHGRSMIIAPQLTLIGQAARKIMKETGIFPAIEQADLRSNESCESMRNPYIVASKQDIGLVIVDEAHYACTQIYSDMLGWYQDRGAKILGVTATPKRHDKRAMGQVFDDCCYQYGIADAVNDGWLVPLRVNVMQIEHMDLRNVASKSGFNGEVDFVQSQLNDLLEDPRLVYEIADATAKATTGKKTAIYCSSVNQACAVANVLKDQYGIRADWICSDKQKCSDKRLSETMASFTDDPDGVTHLCNVGMLTTGWDFPGLEALVNARPTRSQSLYTQIMGRITRPCEFNGQPVMEHAEDTEHRKACIAASAKPVGLVIDLVDASLEHKLITAIDVLGGKWSLAERNQVVDKAAGKEGAVNLDELIAEARREEEEKRIREEMRRKKVAEARFREQQVNPFGGQRSNGRQAERVIEPATKKQMGYLAWQIGKEMYRYDISKRQAMRMIGQLKRGTPPHLVKSTNHLREKGGPAPTKFVRKEQAATKTDVNFDEIFSVLR